ncbi:MAG TPA: DUF433 domain-containing protein [Stellaceae bacterium]|nr:DUF433 domain-containing protein [Stellaceae bacterium]
MRHVSLLERPAYRIQEAARYLRLPAATLRAWVLGRDYPVRDGTRRFQPVIDIADRKHGYLSFTNLVEAHVLAAIRRQHRIPLPKVRDAVRFLRDRFGSDRPLIQQQFQTDGLDLFVEKLGALIAVSRQGQLAMREIIELHLNRIERDTHGVPVRLYPFTRTEMAAATERAVVIDPKLSFGRPAIARLGIPTAVIAERYKAGDSIDALVVDYGAARAEIEEAIRCELQVEAA